MADSNSRTWTHDPMLGVSIKSKWWIKSCTESQELVFGSALGPGMRSQVLARVNAQPSVRSLVMGTGQKSGEGLRRKDSLGSLDLTHVSWGHTLERGVGKSKEKCTRLTRTRAMTCTGSARLQTEVMAEEYKLTHKNFLGSLERADNATFGIASYFPPTDSSLNTCTIFFPDRTAWLHSALYVMNDPESIAGGSRAPIPTPSTWPACWLASPTPSLSPSTCVLEVCFDLSLEFELWVQ